jgi:4-hydroxymandelate oxidase
MRIFESYELKAKQAMGDAAPLGLLYSDEEPNDPRWLGNLRNIAAFQAVTLRPRVMVDVSETSLSTEVLGQTIAFPAMLAPAGWINRFHPDGELAAARAASSVGTTMTLSTCSAFPMEDVAQSTSTPLWFQLYVMKDRDLTAHLCQRAEAAGYAALVVTVDNPRVRPHEWDEVEILASGGKFGNFDQSKYPGVPLSREQYQAFRAADFQWRDLDWLRSITSLPIVLKGIQTPEDAALAAQNGVSGIVVSNHGGYNLPGVAATIAVLPEIADAAGDVEIYLDGGVRSGSDILKAVALGARAVFIGRPMVWGLTVNGEAGVRAILEAVRDELTEAMRLCGVTDIRDVGRSYVRAPANQVAGRPAIPQGMADALD